MTCREILEDASAYVDGHLDHARAEAVRSHLESCAACAAEYRSLRDATDFVTAHWREIEVPDALWTRIEARIAPAATPGSRLLGFLLGRPWRAALAAATLALALAGGLLTVYQQRESQRGVQRYMDDYVRARDRQKQMERLARPPAIQPGQDRAVHAKFSDNPFVDAPEPFPVDNPFRSEEP